MNSLNTWKKKHGSSILWWEPYCPDKLWKIPVHNICLTCKWRKFTNYLYLSYSSQFQSFVLPLTYEFFVFLKGPNYYYLNLRGHKLRPWRVLYDSDLPLIWDKTVAFKTFKFAYIPIKNFKELPYCFKDMTKKTFPLQVSTKEIYHITTFAIQCFVWCVLRCLYVYVGADPAILEGRAPRPANLICNGHGPRVGSNPNPADCRDLIAIFQNTFVTAGLR